MKIITIPAIVAVLVAVFAGPALADAVPKPPSEEPCNMFDHMRLEHKRLQLVQVGPNNQGKDYTNKPFREAIDTLNGVQRDNRRTGNDGSVIDEQVKPKVERRCYTASDGSRYCN